MSNADEPPIYATCYDCDRELSGREAMTATVHADRPDGGYDRIDVPMCPRCHLKRHGHACDHCGELHRSIEAAMDCCVGVTKAPNCPECGRRMRITSRGFHPTFGQTITTAECECCPIGWGRYTRWTRLDGECKHVDDGRAEA